MFGANTIRSGLSLTRILGGLSKTINVAKQVIPIYEEVKPIIGNAKKILGTVRNFTSSKATNKNEEKHTENKPGNKKIPTNVGINQANPVFFQ